MDRVKFHNWLMKSKETRKMTELSKRLEDYEELKKEELKNGLELLDWIDCLNKHEDMQLVRIRKYTDCCTKKELLNYYDKENKTNREQLSHTDYSKFHQRLRCRHCKHAKDIQDKKTYYYIVCYGAASTCDIGDSSPMSCEGYEKECSNG